MIACQKLPVLGPQMDLIQGLWPREGFTPVILGQSLDQIKCERGFNQKLVNFMASVFFFFLPFCSVLCHVSSLILSSTNKHKIRRVVALNSIFFSIQLWVCEINKNMKMLLNTVDCCRYTSQLNQHSRIQFCWLDIWLSMTSPHTWPTAEVTWHTFTSH